MKCNTKFEKTVSISRKSDLIIVIDTRRSNHANTGRLVQNNVIIKTYLRVTARIYRPFILHPGNLFMRITARSTEQYQYIHLLIKYHSHKQI